MTLLISCDYLILLTLLFKYCLAQTSSKINNFYCRSFRLNKCLVHSMIDLTEYFDPLKVLVGLLQDIMSNLIKK